MKLGVKKYSNYYKIVNKTTGKIYRLKHKSKAAALRKIKAMQLYIQGK